MTPTAFKELSVDRGVAQRERDEVRERIAGESAERYRRSVEEVDKNSRR